MSIEAGGRTQVFRRGTHQESVLNLVNLILRETAHRIRIVQIDVNIDSDPPLFVVTRIGWRHSDKSKPVLHQIPRVLSLLETLRGGKGVPVEIDLNSNEGIVAYIPTGERVSSIPDKTKDALEFLISIVESTVAHCISTMREVEEWFWRAARQKGFSPEIVERMACSVKHFDSREHLDRYYYLLNRYFSIRFRIYTAESCLRVEGAE